MAKKKRQQIIKCSKCKKGIFYLPYEYEIDIPLVCLRCGQGKQPKQKVVRTAASNYANTRKGIRDDVHPTYFFNSATEANTARIFDFLNLNWKYEERSFTFSRDKYKNKPWIYVMDFEILEPGDKTFTPGYYEVKGWMDSNSKQRLRRLKNNYPDEFKRTIVILYNKYKKKDIEFCNKLGYKYMLFDELSKEFEPQIPTWE